MRYRFVAGQAECVSMEQQRVCKTYRYQLMPVPEQERAMATVLWRCRELSSAGLQERKAA